jgi:hypothetical protein
MSETPLQRALSSCIVTLLTFAACVAGFLPPMVHSVTESVFLIIVLGIGIATSFCMHLFFVGVAAKAMGRSPVGWVILALCTFPLGSIIGLIALHNSQSEKSGLPDQQA